jgi:hypothetical protein
MIGLKNWFNLYKFEIKKWIGRAALIVGVINLLGGRVPLAMLMVIIWVALEFGFTGVKKEK